MLKVLVELIGGIGVAVILAWGAYKLVELLLSRIPPKPEQMPITESSTPEEK